MTNKNTLENLILSDKDALGLRAIVETINLGYFEDAPRFLSNEKVIRIVSLIKNAECSRLRFIEQLRRSLRSNTIANIKRAEDDESRLKHLERYFDSRRELERIIESFGV